MATFQAVNTMLPVPEAAAGHTADDTTPTTPRPNHTFFPPSDSQPTQLPHAEGPSLTTPTRNSFSGLAAQRPLPATPLTPATESTAHPEPDAPSGRGSSHKSALSMDSSEVGRLPVNEDKGDGSDNESVKSDSSRPAKKKKGQRFFCTDYPPCNLSFTRSEHLARHIRKHTGERPFLCHCSRRFSRMDNLRQHAATVHINEDIPENSLAATVTRYQRQIRTERVRPAGAAGRSRAVTLGSQAGHSRGHSRNLSTSSIASTSSNLSVNLAQDMRRRPQPLAMAMANDGAARARLSLSAMDAYNPPLTGGPGPQIVEYIPGSASATTPTSSTFSVATGSPNPYAPGLQSPFSTSSRPVSWGGPNAYDRRLSVPGGPALSSDAPGQRPPPHMASLPSPGGAPYYTQGRPTDSDGTDSRRESMSDMEWRRRTWHPGSFSGPRPATSSLGYYQSPDAPTPHYPSQPPAAQTTRLPGIESFDHLVHHPPSPMQIDTPAARPVSYHAGNNTPPVARHEKRASISWDTLQRIDRLEIASPNPKRDWSQYQEVSTDRSNRPVTAPHHGYASQPQHPGAAPSMQAPPPLEPHLASFDSSTTPVSTKRQGWYQGPIRQPPVQTGKTNQRTSSEESSSSEGVSTPGSYVAEYRPAIVHTNGYVEKQRPGDSMENVKPEAHTSIMDRPHPLQGQYGQSHYSRSPYLPRRDSAKGSLVSDEPKHGRSMSSDMTRLDALVAVATKEQQAVNRT
ncbi:uncharacterized protein EI97DRAFT_462634 [Westerdykella ornata]|uniref:C2H2-type domain-containing protein n=1 Tax=Westerdykella ornata TaxID=318751 RepID=A0A6A6J646_WESOR|nr:uncharacterized protein EI97DRAFT_462634 [Westerdykella ornata]KAF2271667.1 hypothetical protein EI97DRAFT_462634 [Westerdykella ornata]